MSRPPWGSAGIHGSRGVELRIPVASADKFGDTGLKVAGARSRSKRPTGSWRWHGEIEHDSDDAGD